MTVTFEKDPCGGKGNMKLEKILSPEQMKDKCGLFARVTLHPGDVLGYHEHHGNNECYFILSGEGVYDDNGTKRTVKAGETTWTADGCGHGLSNENGTEDLVFMALIINS
ncbi:MAG: cupin domain-containing protein [Kiritimatiellae bacterium]|jgi:mannose-6-phosphate isomerase-like protein (cupin superfamily)|nr:cupin domain-containing protein [Kiritimatiellia bacterium]